ncbi:MAG TPA: AraC family transcriptional regulator [Flavitalea sp.]|nr:AraC family transcriptional regulator [Flavitalea sp.]
MNNKELSTLQVDNIFRKHENDAEAFFYKDFMKVHEGFFSETSQDFQIDKNCGKFTAFTTPDMHVWQGNMQVRTVSRLEITTLKPAIQMIFCTNGNLTVHIEGQINRLTQSHHNLLFLPAGEVTLELHPDENTRLIIISLSETFFGRLMPPNESTLSNFRQILIKQAGGWLAKRNMNIYQESIFILQNFISTNHSKSHKKLLVEAKVIELLYHQLDQFQEIQQNGKSHSLKPEEIEKMYLARTIILNNLSTHYSLIELAHLVGTNECYLKDHFKKVFGTTVYGFTQKAKMEKAKELILAGGKKISEIAKTTGFKYTSHFTSSFKKYFGLLPNKIKLLFMLFTEEFECLTVFLYECGL